MAFEQIGIKQIFLIFIILKFIIAEETLKNETNTIYNIKELINDNQGKDSNKDQSFYFTNIGPHGFEYHAILDHEHNPFNLRKQFGPFFNGLPEFHQFPNLNNFPGIRNVLVKLTPTTARPVYQVAPEIVHHPTNSPIINYKSPEAPINKLFRRKDITNIKTVHKQKTLAEDYPKIFKFNDERINIIDFDKNKKYGNNHVNLNRGDYLDPDKILRDKFLILHGGVFKIDNASPIKRSEPLSFPLNGNRINFENLPKHHIHYYYA